MKQLVPWQSFSGVSAVDIVLTAFTAYRALSFLFAETIPATDGSILQCRFSTDGGATFDAGSGNYGYSVVGSATSLTSTSDTAIALAFSASSNKIGNQATEGLDAMFTMMSQINTARWTQIFGQSSYITDATTPGHAIANVSGARRFGQDTDAIRFFMATSMGGSAGVFSGRYSVYGWE